MAFKIQFSRKFHKSYFGQFVIFVIETVYSMPWSRLLMSMLYQTTSDADGAERMLNNFLYFFFSWGVQQVGQYTQFRLLAFRQQTLRMLPPGVYRNIVSQLSWARALLALAVLVGVFQLEADLAGGVYSSGMNVNNFLLITVLVLPCFSNLVYPRRWPPVLLQWAICTWLWTQSGVSLLWSGLVLLQAVPSTMGLVAAWIASMDAKPGKSKGSKRAQSRGVWAMRTIWWAALLVLTLPALLINCWALYSDVYLREERRPIKNMKKPFIPSLTWAVEYPADYPRSWEGLQTMQKLVGARGFVADEKDQAYRELGLALGADQKEVKQKFRKLSLELHPDKLKGLPHSEQVAAAERYLRVQHAHELLASQKGGLSKREVLELELEKRADLLRDTLTRAQSLAFVSVFFVVFSAINLVRDWQAAGKAPAGRSKSPAKKPTGKAAAKPKNELDATVPEGAAPEPGQEEQPETMPPPGVARGAVGTADESDDSDDSDDEYLLDATVPEGAAPEPGQEEQPESMPPPGVVRVHLKHKPGEEGAQAAAPGEEPPAEPVQPKAPFGPKLVKVKMPAPPPLGGSFLGADFFGFGEGPGGLEQAGPRRGFGGPQRGRAPKQSKKKKARAARADGQHAAEADGDAEGEGAGEESPSEASPDQTTPHNGKSRLKAAGTCVMMGNFGAHHFYLGQKKRGWVCILALMALKFLSSEIEAAGVKLGPRVPWEDLYAHETKFWAWIGWPLRHFMLGWVHYFRQQGLENFIRWMLYANRLLEALQFLIEPNSWFYTRGVSPVPPAPTAVPTEGNATAAGQDAEGTRQDRRATAKHQMKLMKKAKKSN